MVRGGHSIGPDNVTQTASSSLEVVGQPRVSALLVPCCCPRAVALTASCQRAISPITESSSPLSTSMGHRSPTSTSTSISISQHRFFSYPTTTLVLIADNQDIASYLVSTVNSPLLEPYALGTSTFRPQEASQADASYLDLSSLSSHNRSFISSLRDPLPTSNL
jgi:hypothetical protein